MGEGNSGQEILPGYKIIPTEVKIDDEPQVRKADFELREPKGKVLFREGEIEVIVPQYSNFPAESGLQIQVTNLGLTTETFKETPLLATKAPVKPILEVMAVGIAAEQALVEQTDTAWANLNLHSRPPMTQENPIDAQYNQLTLDIHGRDIKDTKNWTRTPAIHGGWGIPTEKSPDEELESIREFNQSPEASEKDIQQFSKDPLMRVEHASPWNNKDFEGWQNHEAGMYQWQGRRQYTPEELVRVQKIFSSDDFADRLNAIKKIELFTEKNPSQKHFEAYDTDITLWEWGGFQLVTQKNPLIDDRKGIHMVLKLRPEPHTPWDNPKQTLEAHAIGLGVARLLKDTKSLGEIGDAYFDMNANWSMTKKGELAKTMSPEDVKREIQKDTRAHLHIQLEKMEEVWELPPVPGTFADQRVQAEATISEIREILNRPINGLQDWIKYCSGKVFNEVSTAPVHKS